MESRAVKVLLQEGRFVETVWAEPVGADLYRLDNSPFHAYGVSWRDVVEAHPDENGQLRMSRIVEKGGHRTVRVIFATKVDHASEALGILEGVKARGATYEGMDGRYFSLDIPPGVDLTAVTAYLTRHAVRWEHADPEYSALYPDAAGEESPDGGG